MIANVPRFAPRWGVTAMRLDNRHTWKVRSPRRDVALVALALMATLYQAGAAQPPPDVVVSELMEALRGAPATMDTTIQRLAQLGVRAVPALAAGLNDTEIQSGCAEALTRMPASIAVPVFEDAIDRATITNSRDRVWKANLIAALGTLRDPETVPYLENLHKPEDDSNSPIALSIAWALHNITGRDYGPTWNPWYGCRQREFAKTP